MSKAHRTLAALAALLVGIAILTPERVDVMGYDVDRAATANPAGDAGTIKSFGSVTFETGTGVLVRNATPTIAASCTLTGSGGVVIVPCTMTVPRAQEKQP
jgi:hypothetical protein